MKDVRKKVEQIITEELKKAGICIPWDMRKIHVIQDSDVVIEETSSAGTLSEGLIEHHFPAVSGSVHLSHFTKFNSFKNIIVSGEFRLHTILNRLNEKEFKPFAESHGLSGYLASENGKPYYLSLMQNLFYASFSARQPSDEKYMWKHFSDSGTGVKIVFRLAVNQNRSELRPVLYHSPITRPTTVIKTLSDRILKECGRCFTLRGISRIGAFYLPLGFGLEKEEETRLLIKAGDFGPVHDMIVGSGTNSYIPLKLGPGQNDFCDIEIIEVQVGPFCRKNEVEIILHQVGCDDVLVTT